MAKIAFVSDLHYPERGNPLPVIRKLKELASEIDILVGLGDYGMEGLELLKELPIKEKIFVQGNCDYNLTLPEEKVIEVDGLRIGLIHSHQIEPRGNLNGLYHYAKELDVDLLAFGHTHIMLFTQYYDKYFLNPGTAGGALNYQGIKPRPSFAILDTKSFEVKFYIL